MPNWCGNKLILDVSECEKGNEFEEKLVWLKIQTEQPDEGLFEYMCPPADYTDEENVYFGDLYGTKWDVSIPDISSFDPYDKDFCEETEIYKDEKDRYVLVFKTAWGPATGFYDKLMDRNEGMTGTLLYCEQGQDFCGVYSSDVEYHYDMSELCDDHGISKTNEDQDEEEGFWCDNDYIDEVLEIVGDEVGESFCYVDYGG